MEVFIGEVIIAILVLSLGLNIWVAKKIYEQQAENKKEIEQTKRSLQDFKTEVVKYYVSKDEFNRFFAEINDRMKENNNDVIKRIDNMEQNFRSILIKSIGNDAEEKTRRR